MTYVRIVCILVLTITYVNSAIILIQNKQYDIEEVGKSSPDLKERIKREIIQEYIQINANDEGGLPDNLTFSTDPDNITQELVGTQHVIRYDYTCAELSTDEFYVIRYSSRDERVADVVDGPTTMSLMELRNVDGAPYCSPLNNTSYDVNELQSQNLTLGLKFMGRTTLSFNVSSTTHPGAWTVVKEMDVVVVRENTVANKVFIITISSLLLVLNLGFGCQVDLNVMIAILKKPKAPAIGFVCQFLIMPLLGFGVSKALGMNNSLGFGVLVTSCSPGGGASNVWTVLLRGDLDLSLTMTIVSKVAALGMMPFWLWALGRFYVEDTDIVIPYFNVFFGIFAIVVPCGIGVLINKFRPSLGSRIHRLVRPFATFFVIYIVIFGSITNMYIYELVTVYWYYLPAAMLLPYLGCSIGGLLAKLLRQPRRHWVTIALETGFQDTSVAVILLMTSFPAPDGDLAAAMPMMIANCTPLPLLVIFGVLSSRRCWALGKCRRCGGPEAPEKGESLDDDKEKDEKKEKDGGMSKEKDGREAPYVVNDGDVQRISEEKKNEAEASKDLHHNSMMDSTYM